MPISVPYTSRPEDILKLFQALPSAGVPAGAIEAGFFKSLGFSAASGKHLLDTLKKLEFINETGVPAAVWYEYASAENKGLVLALAVKKAYAGLFIENISPYLEDDEVILDFLKRNVEATPRDIELMLQTFRNLTEPCDFQELLSVEGQADESPAVVDGAPSDAEGGAFPKIKVDPNLQVSIQVHIDPATPDDKIETIFKNMRKYLLGKTD